jgi:Family of unknown function (DUF6134)
MTNASAAVVLGLCLGAAPTSAIPADQAARSWHFAVLLDGKRIGEHEFVVTQQDDDVVVDITAHFKVVAAFIPFYVYDHQNHEVWRNRCVTSVASHTNDNGQKLFVQGATQGQAFEVHRSRGTIRLQGCIRTFAYWDRSLLAEPPLLNTQTGELQPAVLTSAGVQSLRVRGQSLLARRFSLKGPHLSIDLWYSDAGDWLALESRLESGRTLRYELQ